MSPETSPALKPDRGAVILVLGILGIAVCFPFGIAAWIMGNTDLREMGLGSMDPSGRALTQAGRLLGIVSVCLAVFALFVGLVWCLLVLILGVAQS